MAKAPASGGCGASAGDHWLLLAAARFGSSGCPAIRPRHTRRGIPFLLLPAWLTGATPKTIQASDGGHTEQLRTF